MKTNPYAIPETGSGYYAEVLDAIPFRIMVDGLSRDLPKWFAFSVTSWFRIRKWLGRSPLPTSAFGGIGTSTVLRRVDMPDRPMSRWADKLEQIHDLGFTPLQFAMSNVIGAKEQAATLWLDESGTMFATFEWIRMPGADGVEEEVAIEFNSVLGERRSGITEIMTAMVAKENLLFADALKINHVDAVYVPLTIPLLTAVEQHRQRLQKAMPFFHLPETAVHDYQELSRGRIRALLETGMIRELTDREVEIVKQNRLPDQP